MGLQALGRVALHWLEAPVDIAVMAGCSHAASSLMLWCYLLRVCSFPQESGVHRRKWVAELEETR